jgi:hypothetical protein
MDKKNKNIQEMRKIGFSQKTLSLLSESEIAVLLEKIKKGETKEATQNIETKTNLVPTDKFKEVTVDQIKKISKLDGKPLVKKQDNVPLDTTTIKSPSDISDELKEGKKKKKKYNPWAVCTAQVGRKDKKKYEKCVMGVKEKIKEGRNPYEYLIESKMEEIVSEHLSPKMTKSELMNIISEKKMMKKPIGKMMSMKGETMENETAPAPERTTTTPAEPKTRPSHPGKNPRPDQSPAPAKAEDEKEKIINMIIKLIGKGK